MSVFARLIAAAHRWRSRCLFVIARSFVAVYLMLGTATDVVLAEPPMAAENLISFDTASREWKFIILHHTATMSGDVESIHAQHRQRLDADGNPWLGIGYHFLIGNGNGLADGAVEATFRWKEQLPGAHAGEALFNAHGVGICLVGNFDQSPPTPAQLETLKTLVAGLRHEFAISPEGILRHGQVKATACPGKHFPMDQILAWNGDAVNSLAIRKADADPQPAPSRRGAGHFQSVDAQHMEVIRHVVSISRSGRKAVPDVPPATR